MKEGKLGTILWIGIIAIFAVILAIPSSRDIFIVLTTDHPYIMGFLKFAILANMGEILAIRITTGVWSISKVIGWHAIVWGVLGMLITLVFKIFAAGVTAAMASGYLPDVNNTCLKTLLFAFFVSFFMNITFSPTFMAFHRITDTLIDMRSEGIKNIKLIAVTSRVDWNGFVSFVVVKTIPCFWIPAHTLTFILQPEYRVIMAAFLSIALGIILSFAKIKK